jgi:hypothetical protein
VFLGWTFTLLEYHTRQYAAVRQHYLRGGDDPNYWRDLHMAEADGTHVSMRSLSMAMLCCMPIAFVTSGGLALAQPGAPISVQHLQEIA